MRALRVSLVFLFTIIAFAYVASSPASASGLSDPSALTKQSGGMTVTQDGAVIENLEIVGTLRIEANNVTVRNVWVYGSEFWSVYVASGSARFEHIEIGHPSFPGSRGIGGNNVVAVGIRIHDVEDGIKLGSNSVYSGVRVYDLNSPSSTPHSDAIQVEGGTKNSTVKNSSLSSLGSRGIGNSAVIIKSDLGFPSNITFSNNYMNGGNYTVYVRDGGYGMPSNISFIGNRFGTTSRFGLTSFDGAVVWENNTWADTGEIINASGDVIGEGTPPATTTTNAPANTTTTVDVHDTTTTTTKVPAGTTTSVAPSTTTTTVGATPVPGSATTSPPTTAGASSTADEESDEADISAVAALPSGPSTTTTLAATSGDAPQESTDTSIVEASPVASGESSGVDRRIFLAAMLGLAVFLTYIAVRAKRAT